MTEVTAHHRHRFELLQLIEPQHTHIAVFSDGTENRIQKVPFLGLVNVRHGGSHGRVEIVSMHYDEGTLHIDSEDPHYIGFFAINDIRLRDFLGGN